MSEWIMENKRMIGEMKRVEKKVRCFDRNQDDDNWVECTPLNMGQ